VSSILDFCMANGRIKGVSPGNRALSPLIGPSIIDHARVHGTILTAVCAACCVVISAGGCSIIDLPPNPAAEDVTPKRKQRAQDAIQHFEKSRDFAQFQSAANSWKRGDVAGCNDVLKRLLERNPDHREGRFLMIETRLASREPQLAVPHAEHLLAVYPKDAQVQHTAGLVLDMIGREKEAVECYRLAAELEPGNELYAVSHRTSRQAAGGTETVAGLTPIPADSRRAEFNTGNDFAGQNGVRMTENAVRVLSPPGRDNRIESVNYADQSGPASAGSLLAKADEALKAGSGELAVAYFGEAISLNPNNPRIPISAAVSALRHNQPVVAQAVAEDALRQFPDSAVLHRTLGMAYYRQGDYQSSQVVLQQALSLDKSSALSYFLMGCTLVKLGQSDGAEVNFRQASRIDPRYTIRR